MKNYCNHLRPLINNDKIHKHSHWKHLSLFLTLGKIFHYRSSKKVSAKIPSSFTKSWHPTPYHRPNHRWNRHLLQAVQWVHQVTREHPGECRNPSEDPRSKYHSLNGGYHAVGVFGVWAWEGNGGPLGGLWRGFGVEGCTVIFEKKH